MLPCSQRTIVHFDRSLCADNYGKPHRSLKFDFVILQNSFCSSWDWLLFVKHSTCFVKSKDRKQSKLETISFLPAYLLFSFTALRIYSIYIHVPVLVPALQDTLHSDHLSGATRSTSANFSERKGSPNFEKIDAQFFRNFQWPSAEQSG